MKLTLSSLDNKSSVRIEINDKITLEELLNILRSLNPKANKFLLSLEVTKKWNVISVEKRQKETP